MSFARPGSECRASTLLANNTAVGNVILADTDRLAMVMLRWSCNYRGKINRSFSLEDLTHIALLGKPFERFLELCRKRCVIPQLTNGRLARMPGGHLDTLLPRKMSGKSSRAVTEHKKKGCHGHVKAETLPARSRVPNRHGSDDDKDDNSHKNSDIENEGRSERNRLDVAEFRVGQGETEGTQVLDGVDMTEQEKHGETAAREEPQNIGVVRRHGEYST